MKLTVEKLLSLGSYEEARIMSGQSGLSNEVKGITIMEDPTIKKWLKGGEALLTSLIPIKNYTDNQMVDFFDELIDRGISALIIKTGKAFDEIPESLIKWGEKNSIPIIEVPKHIFYTDLMYPAMAEVMQNQVNKLTYFKSLHERFRDMAIKNYPIKDVILALSEIIGNPVSLYDYNLNLVMNTSRDEPIIVHDKKTLLNKTFENNNQCFYRKISVKDNDFSELIFEIPVTESVKNYLGVSELFHEVDAMNLIAIENACTTIALAMVRNIAVKEVEEKFMNDIINDLIFGQQSMSSSLVERANLAGIDLFEKYFVSVLTLGKDMETIRYELKNHLGNIVKKYEGAYSIKNDHVIIMVKNQRLSSYKELTQDFINDIKSMEKILKKNNRSISISLGIGGEIKGYENLKKSYDEAIGAIRIGEDIYGSNFTLFYDDLGIFKIIRDISLKSDINDYIPKSIMKVIDTDKLRNREYLKTLEVYLKNNKNIKLTAKELFIHPKTVSYRLEQIKEIGEIDFEDTDQILEIQFAIKIINFLRKK